MAQKIMIASPTQGTVKTAYMKSVLGVMMDLASRGIDSSFLTEEGSDLPLQRNALVNTILNDASFSHIVLVDSDMAFPPDTVIKLISSGKPVIGLICTSRHFEYAKVIEAIANGVPPEKALNHGFDWLAFFNKGQGAFVVDNYITEVESIGFGLVAIAREALLSMVTQGAAPEYRHPVRGLYRDFFYPRPQDLGTHHHFSEDHNFCRRWRLDCGGKVWGHTGIPIYHIGDFGYGGAFGEYLEAISHAAKAAN